jgi:formylglycine-generating enzyme required for sulfatase activity
VSARSRRRAVMRACVKTIQGSRVLFAACLLSATAALADGGAAPTVAPVPTAEVAAAKRAPPPPASVKDPTTGMELVFVKGGCYPMGDLFKDNEGDEEPDRQPVHEVCVDDFYIGKYEVTVGQWSAVTHDKPNLRFKEGGNCWDDTCAVSSVSFEEIQRFIEKLNAATPGVRYRLPTEAEWEYAARSGGKPERFPGGNDVESVSWNAWTTGYVGDPNGVPPPFARPVGLKRPNGLGIHDIAGNVYEIVSDFYDPTYYARSPRDNPKGPQTGTTRVKRGGCAHGDTTNGRTSYRKEHDGPSELDGFRLLRIP